MKTYKDLMNDNKCPPGMKYDKKLKQCVPKTIRYKGRYIKENEIFYDKLPIIINSDLKK